MICSMSWFTLGYTLDSHGLRDFGARTQPHETEAEPWTDQDGETLNGLKDF